MRHKHADLIIAWAEGAEIECLQVDTTRWVLLNSPQWCRCNTYRIKPREPRQFWVNVYPDGSGAVHSEKKIADQLRCAHGETIEVIEVVEVIEDD